MSNSDTMTELTLNNSTSAFDRSKSVGFTAVNEAVTTSFRPLAEEDAMSVAQDTSTPAVHAPHTKASESPVRSPPSVDPTRNETVNGQPPAKKQRLSDAELERPTTHTPVPGTEPTEQFPDNVMPSTGPDTIMVDDYTSPSPASPTPQSMQPTPPTWNPQDIRPETSRDITERLQSWKNDKARADPNTPSPDESLQVSTDATAAIDAAGPSREPNRRKRDFAHRTKSGCHTCRHRKKKCDEAKPTCQNCIRGKFTCGGYGPKNKDINYKRNTDAKPVQHALQPAQPMDLHGPTRVPHGPTETQWHIAPPPSMNGYEIARHGQPYVAPIPPYWAPGHEPRDAYGRPQYLDAPSIQLQQNKLSHVDYTHIHAPFQGDHSRPPLPDSFAPAYRPSTNGLNPPPHDSSSSRRGSQLPPMQMAREWNEREKMLTGYPYRHWRDPDLVADRVSCTAAVSLYNRGSDPRKVVSSGDRANLFAAILDPNKRGSQHGDTGAIGRVGTCGERTVVDSPFHCDYGYNLHLGSEVAIYPGCYIQDPCEITIGNRCTIGPNVNFFGNTFSIDKKTVAGSQGTYLGGAITVGDDCKIGGNVTILAYRTIGEGAIVAAGSVVTRDVKPYTIVAGNPAKYVRTISDLTSDKRSRVEIQEENDRMIEKMRRKRSGRMPGPEPGRM